MTWISIPGRKHTFLLVAVQPDFSNSENKFRPSVCKLYLGWHISLGRTGKCQHGAFSGIAAIVALLAPTVCPVGGGGGCGVYSESP